MIRLHSSKTITRGIIVSMKEISLKKYLGLNISRLIICLAIGLGVVSSGSALADTVKLKANHPDKYTVVKGDTLWDISAHFLENPWKWPEVWSYNPQIKNPHLIYPGDEVYLEYDAQGKPILRVSRGQATVKMSPKVRSTRVDTPIASIPLNAIKQFLGQPRIMSKREIDNAAYIISGKDTRIMSGSGDIIYARGLIPGEDPNSRYAVLRIGKAYRNPGAKAGEILGYEALHVADAQVEDFGDPSVLRVKDSTRETIIGDRLVPKKASGLDQAFIPRPPETPVEGTIISVIDGVSRIGQFQTVVINKGDQDGLQTGHVLAVFQRGKKVRDPYAKKRGEIVTLPDRRAGIVLVYRTFDRVSYALVMEADRDMAVYDSVRNP
ncbi:MAG: LysM peptidoglycan-binding domain-containing protein [Ectothiorhodospiraceae bacterium]|nr:LysM peptidoglycan-binding domain-containing protein [Ectothiorhodospiraceae bacterium]